MTETDAIELGADEPCCIPSAGRSLQPVAAELPDEVGNDTGMVVVAAGQFSMGSEDPDVVLGDGEGPIRQVEVDEFAVSPTAVSNELFATFVDATEYVTEAERFGWSFVFANFVGPDCEVIGSVAAAPWWLGVRDASWRSPEGPGSEVSNRMDHPVVHVSWNDAVAYCEWTGTRLPSEAEWEQAARGGLVSARFPWGDELTPAGEHRCNIWQGAFPTEDTGADGHVGTAPVDAYHPNGFGLYNTSGNTWEWCSDWWSASWHLDAGSETRHNPKGPGGGTTKVMRGGSYLCHDSYCNRYRVAARTSATPDSTTGNTGFRTAAR